MTTLSDYRSRRWLRPRARIREAVVGRYTPWRWFPLLAMAVVGAVPTCAWPWGDATHPVINRLALETVPPDAAAYYRPHLEALARRSLEPDSVMRARDGRAEAIRHFIDLDAHMPPPFTNFPRYYGQAVRRFGRRAVQRNGVLPWVILRFQRQLREAIARGDEAGAIREAAYLGHYVADAYQPLHLTENHDGQHSGAIGLHKRFEDRLVDARIETYGQAARKLLRPAASIDDPRKTIFEAMLATYPAVERIIAADRQAHQKHGRESPAYYEQMDAELAPLAQRQLAAAASVLGSFWLTAWRQGLATNKK